MEFNILDGLLGGVVGYLGSIITLLTTDRLSDVLYRNSDKRNARQMSATVQLCDLGRDTSQRILATCERHYMITERTTSVKGDESISYDIERIASVPNNHLIKITLDSHNRNGADISFCTKRKMWNHKILFEERFKQGEVICFYCTQKTKPSEIYLKYDKYSCTYELNYCERGYIAPIVEDAEKRAKRIAKQYPN